MAERTAHLSVRPVIDGRTARATTNRLDRDGIREVVEEAIAIARLTEPDPDLPPLAEPAPSREPGAAGSKPPPRATPEERARAVAEAIARGGSGRPDRGGNLLHRRIEFFALLNSRGVAAWHRETMARFSITAMAADSSGWAKASACNCRDLDPAALARRAARKAAASRRAARSCRRAATR